MDPTLGLLYQYTILIRRGRPRRMDYQTMDMLAASTSAARQTALLRLDKRDVIVSIRGREDA